MPSLRNIFGGFWIVGLVFGSAGAAVIAVPSFGVAQELPQKSAKHFNFFEQYQKNYGRGYAARGASLDGLIRQGKTELDDRVETLQQMILYLREGDDWREIFFAMMLKDIHIDEGGIFQAAKPFLEVEDVRLRSIAHQLLDLADRGSDFTSYEFLQRADIGKHRHLISTLMMKAPSRTLQLIGKTNAQTDAEFETLLREDYYATDVARRVKAGLEFAKEAETAKEKLAALSLDTRWWVRLYVVHVRKLTPMERDLAVTNRLREDADPIVRGAMRK